MKLSLVVSIEETEFGAVAVRRRWEDGVRLAASLGYEAVELAVRDPATINRQTLRDVIHDSRLAVAAIGTGQAFLSDGLTLTSDDPGIRARASERLASHIALAQEFGAPTIIGLIRGRLARDRATTNERFIEALTRVLPVVERSGERLFIEPINRYETEYLNTIGEVVEIIERVGSPSIQVLADTFHMNIEERSIEGALRSCGSRLGHIHVADSNRHAPGFGHLDFSSILAALYEIGFGGYLSAEIMPLPDSGSAATQAVKHLRSLFTTVQTGEETQ